MPGSSAGGGSLSDVVAPRLLPLLLGVLGGALVSLGVALSGQRASAAARWLLWLPGDLVLDAFVALTLPLVALHAVLTGARVARETLKLQPPQCRWLRLAAATLAAFALSTLLASVLGALLALALQSIVPSSATLAQVWRLPAGAIVAFGCPRGVANGSVALQSDGTLACTQNATMFALDDVARTFVMSATTQAATVVEQVVKVAESVFPQSLAGAFVDGQVVGLVAGGLALGVALVCVAGSEREPGRDGDNYDEELDGEFVLLQLAAQAEAALCRVLNWLLKYLPMTAAFMISSTLLEASPSAASVRGSDDGSAVATALALMAVLLLALVIDVVVMLLLAAMFTRSNPFTFLEHLLPAQLLAISSASPLVALPTTVSSVVASKRVSPPLAFIVCSMGTVLNQTGTALYLSVSTLFVLSVSTSGMDSVELAATQSAGTFTTMMFTNALIATVASPLPMGSKTAALATALGPVYGVPTGPRAVLLAVLAAMEWITDPFVSCVNITNNALISLVVAHYFEAQPAVSIAEPGESIVHDEYEPPTHQQPSPPMPDLRQQRVLGMIHSENWV
ncbi:dicarboxylate/amino acid:cation (Na or H) symporter (DAACS) family protein [Phytophthora cinnamomi]|uniref:dicarboxylate/amino acid:cation (Na or H) symporter (DAACS) family protein n=1 Tax=Phytophthora cinnamomi TaxID=4785 RepID=UPI00355967BE|nr:dicarboxylate/amino acid:cation (Na or H) symporter (DAACS) family protein [Phytophthora cinnamomi]